MATFEALDICIPPTDWGCADESWLDGLDPDVKHRSEVLAWTTLQALSGYRIGLCPVSVRPCAKRCVAGTWEYSTVLPGGFEGGSLAPYLSGGQWYNACGCGRSDECSCGGNVSEVSLPAGIGYVSQVKVDGAVVPSTSYRVVNGNRLQAMGDLQWPTCQNLTLDDTQAGTFSVSYYEGTAPTLTATYAAGVLAIEFAKACTGENGCRLPEYVTAVTRQGVTMEIQSGLFPGGATGIREVDAWIYSQNPYGLKAPSTVRSPDYRPPRLYAV